jgi:NADH dehydrogenase/NADH:ubiquinone oxidoreductase subunit G
LVELTIDGKKVQVPEGTTILEAAKQASINIPHLCYVEGVSPDGACGICVVQVKGERSLTRSCARAVAPGMDVTTNTSEIRNIRKTIIELLMSRHVKGCFSCERNQNCELLELGSNWVSTGKFEWDGALLRLDSTALPVDSRTRTSANHPFNFTPSAGRVPRLQ